MVVPYSAPQAAYGGLVRLTAAHLRDIRHLDSQSYLQVTKPYLLLLMWGGWGSNPRPADYESAKHCTRAGPALSLTVP